MIFRELSRRPCFMFAYLYEYLAEVKILLGKYSYSYHIENNNIADFFLIKQPGKQEKMDLI